LILKKIRKFAMLMLLYGIIYIEAATTTKWKNCFQQNIFLDLLIRPIVACFTAVAIFTGICS